MTSPLMDGAQNDLQQDISKSCLRIRMKVGGHGCMTKMNRFNFGSVPDPDLAYQWDAKRKLFNLAEACALSRAVLVGSDSSV